MQYSKTFAFLFVAFLGWAGVTGIVSEGEVTTVIDSMIQIVGIIGAAWGRWKATEPVNILGFKK